jgi:hypothetical protein
MEQKRNNDTVHQHLSQEVIGALADALSVSFQTVVRMVKKKDIRLTTDKAKAVFARKDINWEGRANSLEVDN